MNRKKGISTLIGTILVLLVTMTALSLFSSWAPNLVQDVMTTTENQTKNQINCDRAQLEIISTDYIPDENITVVIRNTGNIELNTIRLEAWENEIPLNTTTASNIEPADLVTKNISVDTKPTSVRTVSEQCNGAEDRFDDIS